MASREVELFRESAEALRKMGAVRPTIQVEVGTEGSRLVIQGEACSPSPAEARGEVVAPPEWPPHWLILSPSRRLLLEACTEQWQTKDQIKHKAEGAGLALTDNDVSALLRDMVAQLILESGGRGYRLRAPPEQATAE